MDVEKPLITTIMIGKLEQKISYEGIQKLCFGCGSIGQRKENCPYFVRQTLLPMEEGRNEQDVQSSSSHEERVPDSLKGIEGTNGVVHEAEQRAVHEDLYGPWVVVAHKKQGTKNQRSGGNPPGLIKDFVFRGNSNVEVGSPDRAKMLIGLTRESKRRLSSPVSLDRAQIGVVFQRLGNESLQQAQPNSAQSWKVGETKTQSTQTLSTQNSPKLNTVKGKKEIAQSRVSQG